MKFKSKISLFMAAQFLFASAAMASGSLPSPSSNNARSGGSSDSYERGKQLYMQKVACAECKAPSGAENMGDAKSLISRIDAKEFDLSFSERRRVKAYLRNRFEL